MSLLSLEERLARSKFRSSFRLMQKDVALVEFHQLLTLSYQLAVLKYSHLVRQMVISKIMPILAPLGDKMTLKGYLGTRLPPVSLQPNK